MLAEADRVLYGLDYSYRQTIFVLLLVGLIFNYITNVLYLAVFCKYLRPLLPHPRQTDYITNVVLLVLALLTNYRLALLAFSRLFPKPYIPIGNNSLLTPLNYLLITTLVLDLLPLAAAVYLIYKETSGTNLFMLGLDLLIVLVLNLVLTLWIVAVPKN